jgi:hypothetical protein
MLGCLIESFHSSVARGFISSQYKVVSRGEHWRPPSLQNEPNFYNEIKVAGGRGPASSLFGAFELRSWRGNGIPPGFLTGGGGHDCADELIDGTLRSRTREGTSPIAHERHK